VAAKPVDRTTVRETSSDLSANSPRRQLPSISSSLFQSPQSNLDQSAVISINLDACREAFIAVLASVCDPHLNTIHAVCQEFSHSRVHAPHGRDLNPPRPVDRPLNIAKLFCSAEQSVDISYNTVLNDHNLNFDFDHISPPLSFIPPQNVAGPLSVPYIELPHPTFDLEMDANDVWFYVLENVDIGHTDVEALASRMCDKVRCYGFGPVLLKQDVTEICGGECQ
jgi:hypothetical protein